MKTVIFLNSIATSKSKVLTSFGAGVNKAGDFVLYNVGDKYFECDVAVMLGTVSGRADDRCNIIREEIIACHKGRTIHIDGHVLKNWLKDRYYRVSLDSVYYSQANYIPSNGRTKRREVLERKHPQIKLHPWRDDGGHILMLMQRETGWMLDGKSSNEWLLESIEAIRMVSQRKIVVRPHPANPEVPKCMKNYDNPEMIEMSREKNLLKDLQGAWAAVTHNSSAILEPIILGVPSFCTSDDCLGSPVSHKDLTHIEKCHDNFLRREDWANDLAYAVWNTDEMASGKLWTELKELI